MRTRGGPGPDGPRARALLAARHAERLYPGPLGRLLAHELTVHAESAPGPGGGPAEAVVAEVLDRTPPRRALLRSSELPPALRRAT